MATTYIAGYDGSEAGLAAVHLTAKLARAVGADPVAVTVYDLMLEEARAGAQRLLEDLQGFDDVVRRAEPADSAPAGLHRLAERLEASLVTVGVTHRGRMGRLTPGSVAERLLHGTHCPVGVVPAGWDCQDIATVAAAFDGSDESRAAARAAETLAHALGARLVVLAVYDPDSLAEVAELTSRPLLTSRTREILERDVQRLVAELPDSLQAEGHVLRGPAARTLVEACEHDVDLLFTGSRGYGPARAVLLGSVSRKVVDHAPCPVIVSPRGTEVVLGKQPRSGRGRHARDLMRGGSS